MNLLGHLYANAKVTSAPAFDAACTPAVKLYVHVRNRLKKKGVGGEKRERWWQGGADKRRWLQRRRKEMKRGRREDRGREMFPWVRAIGN